MTTPALLRALAHPLVFAALAAFGLLLPAIPFLILRLVWLLARNPITLR